MDQSESKQPPVIPPDDDEKTAPSGLPPGQLDSTSEPTMPMFRQPVEPAEDPTQPGEHSPVTRGASYERPPQPPPPPLLEPRSPYARPPEQPVYQQPAPSPQYPPQGQPPATSRQRPRRRYRKRRTGRRGISCSPSCLVGCLGVVGVMLITMLVGTWVVYASYSNRIDERLDVFDQRVADQNFESTFLYDRQGHELYEIVGQGRRERIPLSEIPDVVRFATIALEDDTFYDNIGVDIPSIIRSARDYVQAGGVVSGASTITQQLVRDVLFEGDYRYERTLRRKMDEALLAVVLTRRKSKDEILELYLNNINYGNLAYGIEAAAQVHFGKSARELELHEAALLAGLPQAPYILNPLSHDPEIKKLVEDRQHLVLDLMVEEGYITRAEADAAKQSPLIYANPDIPLDTAPHFVVYARDELILLFKSQYEAQGYLPDDAEKLAESIVSDGGLRVYTSVDLNLQAVAEQAAVQNVAALRDAHNLTNASIVAIDPRTGEILAMVGSVNFDDPVIDGQVNVALAMRQPGSTMKPFTYSAAMEQGWVPANIIWDTETHIDIPGYGTYSPVNYDNRWHGPVHVRDALANSYNIPAVQTLRQVGVPYLLDFMRRFGVHSLNQDASQYGLSLTLGGGDVTLLELTNAYANFARGGYYTPTHAIICVIDNEGFVLYEYEGGCPEGARTDHTRFESASPVPVIDPRIAFVINDILSDNAARTPAMGASSPLNTGTLLTSAKTGTTNDFRDNWTVGYTSDLVVGVWSGNSDNTPMNNISGLQGAAPIWRDTMLGMYNVHPFGTPQLIAPPGMYQARICNVRGLRDPASECISFRQEWFFEGSVLTPDGRGGMVPAALPLASNQPPPSEYGPQIQEVQPGIVRTYVRPLTPDQTAILAAQNPGSAAQEYCMVPVEVLSSVSDAQILLFAEAPPDANDARYTYRWAIPQNYAILPQFACTPETISGGLPTVGGGSGGGVEREITTNVDPYRIYCHADNSIEVYRIVSGAGVPALLATATDIAVVGVPATNTLIKQGDANIRLYRLITGEFQVNAPIGTDPNGFVRTWSGCY